MLGLNDKPTLRCSGGSTAYNDQRDKVALATSNPHLKIIASIIVTHIVI
jgi:hypothetical protein